MRPVETTAGIQPEYGDEQTDAGRDCRTRLARPNFQARTGTGEGSFSPVQLTTSRIGSLTRLIRTLLDVMNIHTYIYTHTLLVACGPAIICLWIIRRSVPALKSLLVLNVVSMLS